MTFKKICILVIILTVCAWTSYYVAVFPYEHSSQTTELISKHDTPVTGSTSQDASLPSGYYIIDNGMGDYKFVSDDDYTTIFDYDSYDEAVEEAIVWYEYKSEEKRRENAIWSRSK